MIVDVSGRRPIFILQDAAAGAMGVLFHHGLPERSQLLTADGRAWLARAELPAVARQAVRFTGLDITISESDGKRARGHLARQGSPGAALGGTRGGHVRRPPELS